MMTRGPTSNQSGEAKTIIIIISQTCKENDNEYSMAID